MPTFLKGLLALAALTLAPICNAGGGLLLTDAEMLALREQVAPVAGLVARCQRELGHVAAPVSDLSPGDHYGPAGIVKPDKPPTLAPDGLVAYRAALCFALTGDDRYATHSQAILDAWATTLRTVGSPQGHANITFSLPYYAIAAGWVRGAAHWDDSRFRSFLRDTVLPHFTLDRENNHGNWALLLGASVGAYLDDRAVLERARERWQALMALQVDEDGSLPREVCRSDTSNYCGGERKGVSGLSYTHYTLLPTAVTAQILERSGMPVWTGPGSEQLGKAFRRAADWTQHPETFPYYSPERPLNGVRNAPYFGLLQRHYPHAAAAALLEQGRLEGNAFELPLLFGPKRRP